MIKNNFFCKQVGSYHILKDDNSVRSSGKVLLIDSDEGNGIFEGIRVSVKFAPSIDLESGERLVIGNITESTSQ